MNQCPRCGSVDVFRGKYSNHCNDCEYTIHKGVNIEGSTYSKGNRGVDSQLVPLGGDMAGDQCPSLQEAPKGPELSSNGTSRSDRVFSMHGPGSLPSGTNPVYRSQNRKGNHDT